MIAQAVLAEQLTEEQLVQVTPLSALLRILRAELQAGDHAAAKITAGIAAPFCHARLSSADVRVTHANAALSDTEIAEEIAALRAKFAAVKLLN